MDGRGRTTFGEMLNLHKSGLNNETGLGIDIRKPKFGGISGEPEKEWNTNMESFHVRDLGFLYLFTTVEVNYFEPFAKITILLWIVIFFEGWPIYNKVKFGQHIDCVSYTRWRPCFFGWSKQFNHSHPSSTNFNPSYQQQNFTAFHSQPTSTYFNQLHPFTTPYLPLKETDPK